ncbi:molybdopterin-dependent oxidoreductase [Falsiroseomonas sp.]|uniref:molybdopterin-dependent oxidoreductase n=1 Tax=Falsiroseomonas sp. TaxID=2870721 RepID=UPI003562BA26
MLRRHLALLPLIALAAPALAQAPGGREVLRVTGRLAEPYRAGGARFDLAALEALGRRELRTRTAWTGPQPQRFAGVPLARVMEAVGAEGPQLRGVALNDYAIRAPLAELLRDGAFLATRQDDEPLRIRDRGPVWMIFPWSQRPELDVATIRERAIWQLRRLEVG